MGAHATHDDELIPRPNTTPAALRLALAVVDPSSLDEMQISLEEAIEQAQAEASLDALNLWSLRWARDIEIARVPALRDRHHAALRALHSPDSTEKEARAAADDLSIVLDEAMKAVRP